MGFELCGENDYSTYGSSAYGLSLLRKEIERRKNRGKYPHLEAFLENGLTYRPRLFARECRLLMRGQNNQDMAEMCEHFAQAAMRSGKYLVLTDGTNSG